MQHILITGGTGSLGNALISALLNQFKNTVKIIAISNNQQEIEATNKKFKVNNSTVLFCDITDLVALKEVFNKYKPTTVFHLAALKHVDLSQANPLDYVAVNILGTKNVLSCISHSFVKKVIGLSTDKAVAPANVYGATKLIMEQLFINANTINNNTQIALIRSGNILGSKGSIIDKIAIQEKLVFTNLDMTRFCITEKELASFILFVLLKMKGGEVFIPKMKSFKLKDLLKIISIKQEVTYVKEREGEKIHEQLIADYEVKNTQEYKDYYCIHKNNNNSNSLKLNTSNLCERIAIDDLQKVLQLKSKK